MKVVIVGGVAGGASTAARLRRLDEQAEILLFDRGGHVSYANCAFPYFIGGVVEDEGELFLQTPESFWRRFRIQVRTNSEVIRILRQEKKIVVRDLSDGHTYEESYDKLVLSPGAEPVIPPVEGSRCPGVYTLRTVQDTLRIRNMAARQGCRRVVVVGGGFIGLEMAVNLRNLGVEVTLVEAAGQVFPPFDPEMAYMVETELKENGVQVKTCCGVQGIAPCDGGYQVNCADGSSLSCDFAVMAVGVRPENTLACEAGLAVNQRGGIVVSASLQTEDPDIYAVGDAIQVKNEISGQPVQLPLAGPANRQGRIAAENLDGGAQVFSGVIGTSVVEVFHQTAACTGLNEKTLQMLNIPYEKVYLSPNQHAGFYPGACPMTMKLLFSPQGKVLGCQCIGQEGVDKRVDVIAAVLHFKGTVSDLAEMELGYAPAYSSAKDPVNYAGFLAQNVLSGRSPIKHWSDLKKRDHEKSVLVDVRTASEYDMGHLDGSVNIPVDELRERLDQLPGDKELWIYCQVGIRGYIAQRILMQSRPGQAVYNISGGYRLFKLIGTC